MYYAPIRLAAFVFGLVIFPPGTPRISRLALGLALFLFCLPIIGGGSAVVDGPAGLAVWADAAGSSSAGTFDFFTGQIFGELALGFVIGAALSVAARAVSLAAAWISAILFPSLHRRVGCCGLQSGQFDGIGRVKIELLLALAFAVSILESGAFDRIVLLVSRSFQTFPPGSADWSAAGLESLRILLLDLGDAAILVALCSSAPLFFLMLFSELTSGVLRRYIPASFYPSFTESIRVPLVLLLFGMTFTIFINQLQVFYEISVDRYENLSLQVR